MLLGHRFTYTDTDTKMNDRNDYSMSPTKRSLPIPGPLAPVVVEYVKKVEYLYGELDQLRTDHERLRTDHDRLKERFEIFLEANELWDGQ